MVVLGSIRECPSLLFSLSIEHTSTAPTAAQTRRLTVIKVAMIATAANGSLLRYGTRPWASDALLDKFLRSETFPSSASATPSLDEGRRSVMFNRSMGWVLYAQH
jgi:hypothetical protein